MQSTMINSVLKNMWSVDRMVLDDELRNVETYKDAGYTKDYYFFLRRELEVRPRDWSDEKRNGMIRHAKVYGGKFYDYIVDKTFDTIEDWVKDAGGKMKDVLYGENRVRQTYEYRLNLTTGLHDHIPYKAKYVELKDLLKALGYEEPPQVEVPEAVPEPDIVALLTAELEKRGLNIANAYVLTDGSFHPLKRLLGE